MSTAHDNPLLSPSDAPFGAWNFGLIRVEHYVPALEAAIARAKAAVEALKAAPGRPDFANTFVPLERATAPAVDVAYLYSNLRSANGDAAMHALAGEIMPRLVKMESDIYLDAALFARVRAAYESLDRSAMTAEDRTLADKIWRAFKRGGALLGDADKARLRALDEELAVLSPKFSRNVLEATNAFTLEIRDRAQLAGLPESAVEAAAAAAAERGLTGAWVFTLQGPSVVAFMKYAEDRELRERMLLAHSSRAVSGQYSNEALVLRIASLRHERARLLGYPSHAHFQMEERMAESPERVRAFLDRLLERSRAAADRELADLKDYMRSKGETRELAAWDYAYWSNRLKEERYSVSAEALRPYFRLETILEGAFALAGRLFDLRFRPAPGVPVYAPDVQVHEVTSGAAGDHVGLLYVDFHPRATKAGGAWCTRFKAQWRGDDGRDERPHVSIVCNFTAATPGKPSLLTYQEALTLFHEFGHALHSLLSRCRYRSLSCTSVYRDFVELPSQILENWLRDADGLREFARHHETGLPLPDEVIDRIVASDRFHAAYQMLRQLRFGLLDLGWHGADPAAIRDVTAFERRAVAATDVFPAVEGTNISSSFEHIFAGGYSAGYYGYKWAEVLDADAFELFQERGIFDAGVARAFREAVLERGGSEHPMELYKRFRGREPDPDALLRRAGLL